MAEISVAIIIHHALPESTTNAHLLMDAARAFRDKKWNVCVYSQRPSGFRMEDLPAVIEGVHFRRHPAISFDKRSIFRRIINASMVSFFIFVRLLFSRRPTVILADTTSPFLGLVAWALGIFRGIPYVYLVTEIFPGAAVSLGHVKRGGIIERLWHMMNKLVIGRASRIMVLDDRMREEVVRYLPYAAEADHILVVSNWADVDRIKPVPPQDNLFRREHNLEDKVVVMYSGNMGLSHDLETVVGAAALLQDLDKVRFVFIGGGTRRDDLIRMIEERNLSNALLLPRQTEEMLPYSLSAGQFAIISLARGLSGFVHPSRFYPAMAAGQAIIAIVEPDHCIGRLVDEENLGIRVSQGESDKLAESLRSVVDKPAVIAQMQRNARALVTARFTKQISTMRYVEVVQEAMESRSSNAMT